MAEDHEIKPDLEPPEVVWRVVLIVVMLVFSFFANIFNIAVMGQDIKYLELISKEPYANDMERRNGKFARQVLPMRKRGTWTICTVLFTNVACQSYVAILLAEILKSEIIGLIVSIPPIVLIGGIIPQALSIRYGIKISAPVIWLLYFFTVLIFVVAYPIGKLINLVLSEELGISYTKSQMKKLFEQVEKSKILAPFEKKILQQAIDIGVRSANQIMVPLHKVYMLDINTQFSQNLVKKIYSTGHSRIPIYDGSRQNIVGILMVNDLLVLNPKSYVTIKHFHSFLNKELLLIGVEENMESILRKFNAYNKHMAFVYSVVQHENLDPVYEIVGIVCREDLIDSMLKEETGNTDYFIEERMQSKERLARLFSDHEVGKVLNNSEVGMICQFLEQKVPKFNTRILTYNLLEYLIRNSEQIEITSDDTPFIHPAVPYVPKPKELKFSRALQYQGPSISQANGSRWQNIKEIEGGPINHEHVMIFESQIIDQKYLKELQKSKVSNRIKASEPKFIVQDSEAIIADIPEENYLESQKKEKIRQFKKEAVSSDVSPILCVRNQILPYFYLLLSGKVTICSGKDQLLTDMKSFEWFGEQALSPDNFTPDFSAKVIHRATLIRISKEDYLAVISDKTNLRQ